MRIGIVHDNALGVMTNSPTFDWHMTDLRNFIALDPGTHLRYGRG